MTWITILESFRMTDDERRNQYFLARATKRLSRDKKLLNSDPVPGIEVTLNEDDILDWHFVIHGREGTPYQDGVYHGRLVFPPTFPFGPPKILFLTPNGRFKVNERICFSLSDFHPEEWKPAYSVTAVLRGVYDFMHETTDTIGSINTTNSERRRLARESMVFNSKSASFILFFPNDIPNMRYILETHTTERDYIPDPLSIPQGEKLHKNKIYPETAHIHGKESIQPIGEDEQKTESVATTKQTRIRRVLIWLKRFCPCIS